MAKQGYSSSESKSGASRRAVLGALGSAPLLSTLPIGTLAASPSWDALVTAYYTASANVLPYGKAFDAAERRAFESQGPDRIAAQDAARQADELYGRYLDRLEEAARRLLEAPAPTIGAVILKLEISVRDRLCDGLETVLLADLRRLEARHGRV